MALVLISPPPVEPVTLQELKEFLRVDAGDTSQDNLITELGVAARSWAEIYTRRSFVAATWQLLMDFFPGYIDLKLAGQKVSSPFVSGSNAVLVGIRYAVQMPFPPVNSIVSVTYQNANGQVTALTQGNDYIADLLSNPARLTPPFGQMWPVARVVVNAVAVTFTAGYAQPVAVSLGSPLDYSQIQSFSYQFQATDVGRPISIPGGGPNGGTLNTVIARVPSPPDGTATLRDSIAEGAVLNNVTALLVNAPSGQPRHWSLIKSALKILVARWYELRVADDTEVPAAAKNLLMPVRDLRL